MGVHTDHPLVPDAHLLNTGDFDQCQPLNIAGKGGDIDGLGHGNVQAAWAFDGLGHARDGQGEVPGTLQFPQGFVAAADLWL